MKEQNLQIKLIEKLVNKKFEYWKKEFIKKLKENWKAKCKRMEIMSGEVAIYELNCEIDKFLGDLK